ncbi:MAG: hypothetical protein PHR82_06820 [Endomicrobiaceae bacterium]|nr:hypothetical protein [Endomicrobiaceae bacterium]
MAKKLIFCLFLFFFMFGCSTDENNMDLNEGTDYYYETGNKFILSGHQKIKAGDFAGATEDFTKAIEELPEYAYAYGFRAFAKQQAGDLPGALIDINKAIEMKDSIGEFYIWRAGIYKDMGDDNSMNINFEKAAELKKTEAK